MKQKRSYLLETARTFEMEEISSVYDDVQHINILARDGQAVPLVNDEGFGRTESKTMQAPGDDDPDPEDMACY